MYSSLWETHRRTTEHHLPYGITQRYLPPDTGESATPQAQPSRPVLDSPTTERQKTELTLVLVIYRDGLPVHRQSVIHSSSNHLIAT